MSVFLFLVFFSSVKVPISVYPRFVSSLSLSLFAFSLSTCIRSWFSRLLSPFSLCRLLWVSISVGLVTVCFSRFLCISQHMFCENATVDFFSSPKTNDRIFRSQSVVLRSTEDVSTGKIDEDCSKSDDSAPEILGRLLSSKLKDLLSVKMDRSFCQGLIIELLDYLANRGDVQTATAVLLVTQHSCCLTTNSFWFRSIVLFALPPHSNMVKLAKIVVTVANKWSECGQWG